MSLSSKDAYDALAPDYREYARVKSAYIKGVDNFVLQNIPKGSRSLLDIGSGDGIRGMSLAQQAGISDIVLCDESTAMAALCRKLKPTEVWECSLLDLPVPKKRFDIILCLWNVLGHLSDNVQRIAALNIMKDYLTDQGRIFFDINNRHNAASYGWLKVLGRIMIDTICFSETRGNATYDWKINDKIYPGMGHLFTKREMENIIKEGGLRVLKRSSISYSTGVVSSSIFTGQLVYLAIK